MGILDLKSFWVLFLVFVSFSGSYASSEENIGEIVNPTTVTISHQPEPLQEPTTPSSPSSFKQHKMGQIGAVCAIGCTVALVFDVVGAVLIWHSTASGHLNFPSPYCFDWACQGARIELGFGIAFLLFGAAVGCGTICIGPK